MVDWFNDPAVSGADPIESRPGFSALLDRIEGNGVRTVIVEDASRFARDLVAQELGVLMLIKRGMRVITASGDDLTEATDPSRIADFGCALCRKPHNGPWKAVRTFCCAGNGGVSVRGGSPGGHF